MTREWERRRGPAPQEDAGANVVRSGFEPCLLALLRLSVRTEPGTDLATGPLPRALARTGHLVRAAELTYTIPDGLRQGTALVELVKAAASTGDLHGAQALADCIPLPQPRDQALVALVPAWARAGERDRAVALAERIRYPHNWGRAWALLAKAVADSGDTEEALGFAIRADEASSYAVDGTEQVLALLVEVAVSAGDHDRAAVLADRLEGITRFGDPSEWALPRPVVTVLAREVLDGDLDRLDALLRAAPGDADGGRVCGWGADETVEEDAGPSFVRSPLGARDMARVLDAVAETAGHDVALALAVRAETMLETGDGRDHDTLLRSLTLLLARHGQVERALALADGLDPDLRGARQADVVGEVARSGDTGGAESLAHAITDRSARARALIDVVRELARRGDPDRAEALVASIDDRWAQGEALVAVARERARQGDPGRAETLARSIPFRGTRARALAELAELAESSETSDARRLAAQVVVLGGWGPVLPVLERIAPRSVAVIADRMSS